MGLCPLNPSAAGSVSSAVWQARVPELGLGWGQALSDITWLLLGGEEASALRGPVLRKLRPPLAGATRVLRPHLCSLGVTASWAQNMQGTVASWGQAVLALHPHGHVQRNLKNVYKMNSDSL